MNIIAPIILGAVVAFLIWSTVTARKRGYESAPWIVFWATIISMAVITIVIAG